MRASKIYISGPMYDGVKCYYDFCDAEVQVQEPEWRVRHTSIKYAQRHNRMIEFKPVNPLSISIFNVSLFSCPKAIRVIARLAKLSCCQYVYMLKGWMNTTESAAEHKFAKLLKKEIIYQ